MGDVLKLVIGTVLVAFFITCPALSQEDGSIDFQKPNSGNLAHHELAAIATAIRALESSPQASNASQVGAELTEWMMSSPDITVSLCGFPSTEMLNSESRQHSLLFAHYILGMAASMIESPADADDRDHVVMSGLESALTVYEYFQSRFGDQVQDKFLDKLIKQREKGKLEKYVRKRTSSCS